MKLLSKLIKFLNSEDGSLKQKTIRATIWVTISRTFLGSLTIVRTIILARLLSPEIFGIVGICMILVRGLDVITQTGFGAALIQRQDHFKKTCDTAFTLMVIRGFLLAIILAFIAPYVAIYYDQEILGPLTLVLAIAFIFSGFQNINIFAYQKKLSFKKVAYVEQSKSLLSFIFVIPLAFYLQSAWALAIGHVLTVFFATLLSFIILEGKPRLAFNKRHAIELFQYGKFITGVSIILFIATELDNIVIGKVLGMETLGYYVIAYMLANLPATHFSKVVATVIFPVYSKLQNDLPALCDAYVKTLRIVALITIPASVGIAILADDIITVVYGEKWSPAINAVVILSVFGCMRSISMHCGYLFNAIGKPNIGLWISLGKLILVSIIIYPLTMEYGIVGTSIAVTLPVTLEYFIEIYLLKKTIGLNISHAAASLWRPVLFSAVMGATLFAIKLQLTEYSAVWLIALIIIGAVIYFATNLREIRILLSWLKSAKQA